MNSEHSDLDALVSSFASDWLRLGDASISSRIVTDPILVLGPDGTVPIPRAAFLA